MSKSDKKRAMQIAGLLQESEYNFEMEVPSDIMTLFNAFHKHGKKLYIVGGAVRDAMLGKIPKDFDVVTDALPDEVEEILDLEKISNFPSGKIFGIISAVMDNDTYEVATFRADKYTPEQGRKPVVVYGGIEDDAQRRDLSINALYYDIQNKKIIDLVGGVEDLKNKKIRPVGNAFDRFTEDKLRTLRALRFAHRFGSSLDKETIDAIIHYKQLPDVSNERIRDEFYKSLESSHRPEEFLEQFLSLGLGPRTFGNVQLDTRHVKELRNPVLVLAKLLWKNDSKSIASCLSGFKASSYEIKAVIFLKTLFEKFNEFDVLVFNPSVDGKWLEQLVEQKRILFQNGILNIELTNTWAEIMGLNRNLISNFIQFNSPIAAKDFPELAPGKELGDKITIENAKLFISKL